jgi:hypothetical protein
MPKLSIYLKDDLWERAQTLAGAKDDKPNASALVQRALELMLRERETRNAALSAAAVIDRERLDAVVARVRAGAREEFERGYASGLDLVEAIGFGELGEIIQWGTIEECEPLWDDPSPAAAEWLNKDLRKHREFDEDDRQHEAFRAGANKAVRDVWEALRSDNWGLKGEGSTPAASERPEQES